MVNKLSLRTGATKAFRVLKSCLFQFSAIVYCFNVSTPPPIQKLADKQKIPIRSHKVIYKLVDDVKEEISKKLPPGTAEEILGEKFSLQSIEEHVKRLCGCQNWVQLYIEVLSMVIFLGKNENSDRM